jgi:dihydroxyacetone kinase
LNSIDTCGGTLGAIFSIFLAALTTEVRRAAAAAGPLPVAPGLSFWGKASLAAIETLKLSTAARVGHRTVMDALIPFVEGLASAGAQGGGLKAGFAEAAARCRESGEGTARLVARLGRATYVGDGGGKGDMPPDPGAMSVVALTEGMVRGMDAVGLE